MATKETEEQIIDIPETLSKTEEYIEENKNSLTVIFVAILVIVGGYLLYQNVYVAGQEDEARSDMFMAELYFERDSFNLALAGDGQYLGFLDIIDDYGVTKSANLSHFYAGICYLKTARYEEAIEYLTGFDSDDEMVAPIALGAIGDANMELGNIEDAYNFYTDAAEKNDNAFTSPIFFKKAAFAAEKLERYDEAQEIYETIKEKYPESQEGKSIEKYLHRAKAISETAN